MAVTLPPTTSVENLIVTVKTSPGFPGRSSGRGTEKTTPDSLTCAEGISCDGAKSCRAPSYASALQPSLLASALMTALLIGW